MVDKSNITKLSLLSGTDGFQWMLTNHLDAVEGLKFLLLSARAEYSISIDITRKEFSCRNHFYKSTPPERFPIFDTASTFAPRPAFNVTWYLNFKDLATKQSLWNIVKDFATLKIILP